MKDKSKDIRETSMKTLNLCIKDCTTDDQMAAVFNRAINPMVGELKLQIQGERN